MDLPFPTHLVTSLLQLPKSPTERAHTPNIRPPLECRKTSAKHPPFQLLVAPPEPPGTSPGAGHLANTPQLPAPQELDTSALGLLQLLRGHKGLSTAHHLQLCAHTGERAAAAWASWVSRPEDTRVCAAPRAGGAPAPAENGGGAGKPPGAERGRFGGRRRRSAAPAGRGGTSGPAGKLPDWSLGLPQAARAAPAATPPPRAGAARPHDTWPGAGAALGAAGPRGAGGGRAPRGRGRCSGRQNGPAAASGPAGGHSYPRSPRRAGPAPPRRRWVPGGGDRGGTPGAAGRGRGALTFHRHPPGLA